MSAKKTAVSTLEFPDNKLLRALGGPHAKHFARIEQKLNVGIDMRGNLVAVEGKDRDRAGAILRALYLRLVAGESVTLAEVDAEIRFTDEARVQAPGAIKTSSSRAVRPRSPAQAAYLEMMRRCPLVFGIGPAGTGKTYLAAAFAAHMLHEKRVERLILSRPALEAGERLGFLPGTLQEKIDPYLRPLYDALYDLLDQERVDKMIERNVIEVAPLAFMRGRTLNDAFIIMDEAQNTTSEQMKMFLTRLGNNAKAIITGDVTQIDLPNPRRSGLLEAMEILKGVDGIRFIHFEDGDVVRHHLVQRIIRAYDSFGRQQAELPLGLEGEREKAAAKPQ